MLFQITFFYVSKNFVFYFLIFLKKERKKILGLNIGNFEEFWENDSRKCQKNI